MSVQAISQNTAQMPELTTTTTSGTTGAASATAQSTTGKPAGSGTPPASYSVSISSAGRAALAEATETSVQTAKEAGAGDLQAKRLLAKEAAAKAA